MLADPLISVLLPAWNAARTLPRALASITRQSYTNWECIVVDDGSTDGTWQIAQTLSQRDTRIKPVRIAHAGIVPALLAGLERCAGAFVARLDADDSMHSSRLRLQSEALLSHPQWCGVGSQVRLFPRPALTAGRLAYESWLNSLSSAEQLQRDRFVECPLAHPTLCLRREVLQQFPYREAPWAEDYDLLLRVYGAGEQLGTVAAPLVAWRDSPGRLSRTHSVYSLECFVRCKAHFLAQDWLGTSDRYVLWGYGSTGRQLCRALIDLGKRPSHIVELHPGRLGQRIAGAPVIRPEALAGLAHPLHMIVSVAGAVPRGEVRAFAHELGLREGHDYVCAA